MRRQLPPVRVALSRDACVPHARRQPMRPYSMLSCRSTPLAAVLLLLACRPNADPAGLNPPLSASRTGVPYTEGLASPDWQSTAGTLLAQARIAPFAAGRLYAFVGVAQYLAVQRAEASAGGTDAEGGVSGNGIGRGGRGRPATARGAGAGAAPRGVEYPLPRPPRAARGTGAPPTRPPPQAPAPAARA